MNGPRRRPYTEWEIDAYVREQQDRRYRERVASGEWEIGEDEWSWLLGPVLVRVKKTEEE